ncbi:uncharacterized protein LOC122393380 [Amphibalanus amphitrite]|uniref:uncharacterized protein LOC122393380 n=1 Tax=Amphibalanus amphitrite TaxID=1232801 RepID=UPI001C910F51|nr:uncharacterized protein LOC122393380 [Amphibalanus amphitrite]
MARAPLAIAVVTVLLISQAVAASRINCQQTNCEFHVLPECQDSKSVYCNLKDRPYSQINLTSASFPKHVREITIRNVHELVVEADAIASLPFIETIKLHNISTLTLHPRSLARDVAPDWTDGRVHEEDVEVQEGMLSEKRNSRSEVHISNVEHCRVLGMAVTSSRLGSLHMQQVTTLEIEDGAFSASTVDNIRLAEVKSLTISKGAFTSNVTIKTLMMEDVDTLTLQSGAFAQRAKIRKMFIKRTPNLIVTSGGIKADIDMLTLEHAEMETCEENTFGSNIKSLSLVFSHIKYAKAECVAAGKRSKKLLVDTSRIDHMECLAIHGTIDQVEATGSDFGTVVRGGFTLNVTRFSVQKSTFDEVSGGALEVHASDEISFEQCTINVLKREALSMLEVKESLKARIILENLKVETPEDGSMQLTSRENILIQKLEVGIPCTCDMKTAIGLTDIENGNDARAKRQTAWPSQICCKNNGTWPTLKEYELAFCSDPVTTTKAPTIMSTTATTERPPIVNSDRANRLTQKLDKEPESDEPYVGLSNECIIMLVVTSILLVLGAVQLRITIPFIRQHGTNWRSAMKKMETTDSESVGWREVARYEECQDPISMQRLLGAHVPTRDAGTMTELTFYQTSSPRVSHASTASGESNSNHQRDSGVLSDNYLQFMGTSTPIGASGNLAQHPGGYMVLQSHNTVPQRGRVVRGRTPNRRRWKSAGEIRYSLERGGPVPGYPMNRQKDPRVQQLARDPRCRALQAGQLESEL